MKTGERGFNLTGLLVVISVLALLGCIVLYVLASTHKKTKKIGCTNMLKQCGLAFKVWEGDNNDKMPMAVPVEKGGTKEYTTGADTFRHFQVMSNELGSPKIVKCPNDLQRTYALDFSGLSNQNVSYFVGLDAKDEFPQRFLAGDRYLIGESAPENGILKLTPGGHAKWASEIHGNSGNIGFADGSVQSCTSDGLMSLLQNSGAVTNTWRITLPQ